MTDRSPTAQETAPAATGPAAKQNGTKQRPAKRQRRRRGSITAEDIVTGAFELATEVSIPNLSMPVLAKHLDVGVTSIYWYFRKKEDLLDAMTVRATEEYHFAIPFVGEEDWRTALQRHFRDMRRVFREKPVLCDLVLMRTYTHNQKTNSWAYQKLERVIDKLVEAGFTAEDALDIYMALSSHSSGTAVLDHLATQGTRSEPEDRTERVGSADSIDESTTPLLYGLTTSGHTINAVAEMNFEFTLNALLDRASELLAQTKASTSA